MENAKIIKLNVSGTKYDVSLNTLTIYPNSMLARLILGNIPSHKVGGRIFMDRNGELFNYILDYLRNGEDWILPPDKYLVQRINLEAKFYCIDNLVKLTNDYTHKDKRIELWKKYPIPRIYVSMHSYYTRVCILPKELAEKIKFKNFTESTSKKRFKGNVIAKGIELLYINGYDLVETVRVLNGQNITYYFKPRYPVN